MKKRKQKIIFIIMIIAVLLVISVIIWYLFTNQKIEYKESITIQVGDQVPTTSDYFKDINDINTQKIKWQKLTLEDGKAYTTGTYKGIITYHGKKITLNLIVKDKEAPKIEQKEDIVIEPAADIDLLKFFDITDNSHDKISTEIIGDYDTNTEGEYNLTLQATDKANNKTQHDFTLTVQQQVGNTVGKTSKGYNIQNIDGIYYINNILIANKSYDLPSTYAPGALLEEFNIAFSEMQEAAKQEGININIVSGYRSYSKQTSLYNNYVAKDGKAAADTYSARPGHSEHQTGLAADLNMVDTSFENTAAGKWLANNCYKYGFILRYPKGKESITGYIYEPWHFRFIGDEAKNLYNNGNWITLEEYLGIDSVYE